MCVLVRTSSVQTLGRFERLLLLRAMRPDRLLSALKTFVMTNLGSEYVQEEPFSMKATYQESSPSTPIFFVLFPGKSCDAGCRF